MARVVEKPYHGSTRLRVTSVHGEPTHTPLPPDVPPLCGRSLSKALRRKPYERGEARGAYVEAACMHTVRANRCAGVISTRVAAARSLATLRRDGDRQPLSLSLSLPAHAYLHALRAPSMKASSACTHRVACRTPCVGRAPGTTTRARAARPRRVNMPGDTTATLPTRHRLMRASKGPN